MDFVSLGKLLYRTNKGDKIQVYKCTIEFIERKKWNKDRGSIKQCLEGNLYH